MFVDIILGGVPLIHVSRDTQTGSIQSQRTVTDIRIQGARTLASNHTISLLNNDAGRKSIQIQLEGAFHGQDIKEEAKKIRALIKKGEPVTFVSDISALFDVTEVLVESFSMTQKSGSPSSTWYRLALKEYVSAVEDKPAPGQEEAAGEAADKKSDDALKSVNYLTGRVLDAEDEPVPGVDVLITFDDGEYRVKTGEDGVYSVDNLEPGEYVITVDYPGYKEKEVTVG